MLFSNIFDPKQEQICGHSTFITPIIHFSFFLLKHKYGHNAEMKLKFSSI